MVQQAEPEVLLNTVVRDDIILGQYGRRRSDQND
jgi:hypothetical protein